MAMVRRRAAARPAPYRRDKDQPPPLPSGTRFDARPAVSRVRSGTDIGRAVRGALVRARLYRRHPARLGLRARASSARKRCGAARRRSPSRFRRFRGVDHARHHPRRPHRLCAVLQPAAFHRASARDRAALEGRHVVSWRRRRLRRRHHPVRLAAPHLDAVARRRDLRGRADRTVSRAHRQFHQRRVVGPSDRRALGHGVSEWRADPAPSEPALRGRARRRRAVLSCSHCCCAQARSSGRG